MRGKNADDNHLHDGQALSLQLRVELGSDSIVGEIDAVDGFVLGGVCLKAFRYQ